MLSSLFDSSTIPVLEQVVNFAQARHNVLAGNIANLDTPGYRSRDLSPEAFQTRMKQAIQSRNQSGSWTMGSSETSQAMQHARQSAKELLFHDDSNVSLEQQVAELNKNQMQHNMALSIMTSQFRLLEAAISERV